MGGSSLLVVLKDSLSNLSAKGLLASLGNPVPADPEPLPHRQHQKRLNTEEITRVVERYKQGATVYELAAEFDCHRKTISGALRRVNVRLRLDGLADAQIDEAVQLYLSGLSLARVGERLGVTARTVQLRLRERGVVMRDTHGRVR